MTTDPADIIRILAKFTGPDLSQTIGRIEGIVKGISVSDCDAFLQGAGAGRDVLTAAAQMKRFAGQINVTIHALGILLCLPHILEPGETVEYVSLGAGNTGRVFDLETNLRVAEFKFIRWQGGAETIRQNSIFKDFVLLEGHPTSKRKYLYVLGTHYPLKFFNSGRALKSVLSRNAKLQDLCRERFGDRYYKVRDYYADHKTLVQIEDALPWLSELAEDILEEAPPEEALAD